MPVRWGLPQQQQQQRMPGGMESEKPLHVLRGERKKVGRCSGGKEQQDEKCFEGEKP